MFLAKAKHSIDSPNDGEKNNDEQLLIIPYTYQVTISTYRHFRHLLETTIRDGYGRTSNHIVMI